MNMLFPCGRILATCGVSALIEEQEHFKWALYDYLNRHLNLDCPELDDHDKQQNKLAVAHGGRVVTSWTIGTKEFFIITDGLERGARLTEWTATTIMFKYEY